MFALLRRSVALVIASTILVVFAMAGPAAAHDPGTTAVEIESDASGLDIQIDLPIDELGEAIGQDIATDTFGLSQQRDEIVGYVDDYFSISEAIGTTADDVGEWSTDISTVTVIRSDGRQYVRAALRSEPAAGDSAETFTITSGLIVESDDNHEIVITVLGEDGAATIAGILDSDSDGLTVSGTDEVEASFGAIVGHGFDHVLEGADHLLFLVTLLLPAPMVVAAGRWRSSPGFWRALKRVLHIATAFMIGHSLSLAATALGVISFPTRLIEILIALSVAVSAFHALRPLTARGDVVIAAGFGLVHGVAFAEILANYGLEGGSTLRTLLAFNLGVEAAQLITIGVAFPSLWLLSRTRFYPVVRTGGASLALVMAMAWVVERLQLTSNPFAPLEDAVIDHLLLIGSALASVAVIAWMIDRRGAPSPAPETCQSPSVGSLTWQKDDEGTAGTSPSRLPEHVLQGR